MIETTREEHNEEKVLLNKSTASGFMIINSHNNVHILQHRRIKLSFGWESIK